MSESEKKFVKVTKWSQLRRSKNARVITMVLLLLVVAGLFFFWGKFKLVLVGVFIILLAALGLETSGNDWDLGKLIETGSFQESQVEKNDDGNWMIGERCNKDNLNCSNFEFQEDAQMLFEECGGLTDDVHGLDGDTDGIVCEALPSNQ